MSFRQGEIIYAEGDPAVSWYEVIRGAVCACKMTTGGRRQVVEVHLPGDVFGLEDTVAYSLSAEGAAADGVTVLIRRCRRRLDALVETDPRLARRLRETALRDLGRARGRLLLLGRAGAAERVAAFLLDMSDRLAWSAADPSGEEFAIPLTRGDIADHIGLTLETVSRTLQALRRAGVIGLPGPRRVRILDRRALERMHDGLLLGRMDQSRHVQRRPPSLAA